MGVVIDGVEDFDSPVAREWSPALENYRFIPKKEGTCIFEVEQDVPEEQAEEFKVNWEKAFDFMNKQLDTSSDVGKVITLREKSLNSAEEIWERLVTPEKVMTWNYSSDDWHCPNAKNYLEDGCLIEERFEIEQQNNLNLQRQGWQNILKNLAR